MPYAQNTTVPASKSQAEIQALLEKHECGNYGFIRQDGALVVMFDLSNRRIRFTLKLPALKDFRMTASQKTRTKASQESAYDQEVRRLYRALLLTIKAKLESVESGIETFEDAFLAQIVLPSGETMSEWSTPQIAAAYSGQPMQKMLPDVSGISDIQIEGC